MAYDIWQQLLVVLTVTGASTYIFWTVAGAAWRLRLVAVASRVLPPLRGPLRRIRLRLESPAGCSACRNNSG